MGGNERHAGANHAENQPGFILRGHQALDGGKHQRVMGDNQVSPGGFRLVQHTPGHVQGHMDTPHRHCRVAQQQPRVVEVFLSAEGGHPVNDLVNILYSHHDKASSLRRQTARSDAISCMALSSCREAARMPRSLSSSTSQRQRR